MKFDLGSENWFGNEAALRKALDKRIDRDAPLRFLEIGSWKGRSTLFFLDNYLRHPDSEITCVDTWSVEAWEDHNSEKAFLQSNPERADELGVENVFEQFKANIAANGYESKTRMIRKRSAEALPELPDERFDFVYVDGDHSEAGSYADLTLAWPKLKPGGVLFGDDWKWEEAGEKPVRKAAKRFADERGLVVYPRLLKRNGYYFLKPNGS
jgi:predicted O-methyltransferase YrrM